MANKLVLFAVSDTKELVQGQTNGGGFALPPLVQNDTMGMSLTILEKNQSGGITNPFTVDQTQSVVRVGIVTPNSTAPTVHALGTLVYQTAAGTYFGSLSLATQEIATLLGSSRSVQSTFEIEVTSPGNSVFTIQKPVTVSADGLKTGTPINLTGTQSFYDASTTDSLFLKRTGAATAQGDWNVSITHGSAATQARFTRDTDLKVFGFGSWTGAAWSDNTETIARRGDVVLLTGGTLTGQLNLATNPGSPLAAAPKQYVDVTALAGGTLTARRYQPLTPVSGHELVNRDFVIANSGTTPIGEGLIRQSGSLVVDFGIYGTQVPRATHTHHTGTLTENTNLFFTEARVRSTAMTAIDVVTQGNVTAGDSVLTSVGKLQSTKVSTSAGTFSNLVRFAYATASQPSITNPTGEDTGIFFPSADPNAVAFSSSAAEVARISEGGLSVGTTSHIARVGVVGGANEVQLAVRGHSTQSSDLLQTQDSAGNIKLKVNQHHALEVSSDGIAAAGAKGLKITASSASGAAGVELINNLGGSSSGIKLTGSSMSPANTLLIANESAGDVALRTDGISRLVVKESGNVEVTGLRVMASGASSTEGGVWQDSTQKALQMFIDGLAHAIPGVMFTGTADKVVGNTTSETSLVPTGVPVAGALSLPANWWTVGKTIRVTFTALLRTKASSPGTLNIKVKYGSTILANTGGFTPPTALSDAIARFTALLTCRSTGVSGVVICDGMYQYLDGSTFAMTTRGLTRPASGVVNTTASGLFDITAQWSLNDVSNVLTVVDALVEALN